ncbi:hypothetical protein [Thiobacillus denitrificans]|uniref:hypothetical protein n=1 Tax=Thiobacillus denitrificans TaxID=36861 RepID=UPI001FE1E0B4|nr:hypothetical protein [Thiobacillus denitrificans]
MEANNGEGLWQAIILPFHGFIIVCACMILYHIHVSKTQHFGHSSLLCTFGPSLLTAPLFFSGVSQVRIVEWFGSLTGLLGAGLLALNADFSGWGFAAFLVSNFAWIAFGVMSKSWGLVTMQVGFTATSILGMYRWL